MATFPGPDPIKLLSSSLYATLKFTPITETERLSRDDLGIADWFKSVLRSYANSNLLYWFRSRTFLGATSRPFVLGGALDRNSQLKSTVLYHKKLISRSHNLAHLKWRQPSVSSSQSSTTTKPENTGSNRSRSRSKLIRSK